MIFKKNYDGLYNRSYFSYPEDDFINVINEDGDEFDIRTLFTIWFFISLYSFYYSFKMDNIFSSIALIILGCIIAAPLIYSIIYCKLINSYKKSQLVVFKILISDTTINELTRNNVYSEAIEKAFYSYIIKLSKENTLINKSKVICNKLFFIDFLNYKKTIEYENRNIYQKEIDNDKVEKLSGELLDKSTRTLKIKISN